jgi:hypothetical protein
MKPNGWIHGAGILMQTRLGYIDGIHEAPYMAYIWIRHGQWMDQWTEKDKNL